MAVNIPNSNKTTSKWFCSEQFPNRGHANLDLLASFVKGQCPAEDDQILCHSPFQRCPSQCWLQNHLFQNGASRCGPFSLEQVQESCKPCSTFSVSLVPPEKHKNQCCYCEKQRSLQLDNVAKSLKICLEIIRINMHQVMVKLCQSECRCQKVF